ncbi:MAG: NAD(+) diphosphatase [Pseudomonadota bacterium]|nr:NAD(+) diphosphatase [Pseudomonadota bacterium]
MPFFFDHRTFREASYLNGFSGNSIERWSEGRDEASLAEALAAENAGFHLFAEDRAIVKFGGERIAAFFRADEARELGLDPDSLILLGIAPEGPRFAGLVAADTVLPEGIRATDLRSLAVEGALAAADLAALAHARSYLHWHSTNRFCGRCGGPLAPLRGGVSRKCQACGTEHFPRVDPVVIMLAIDGERCLLGRQPRFAPGMYSALAGFLEPGEAIEEAVRREVKEEAGIRIGRVAYYSSQAWPFPSSLMIGCHAEAISTEVERDAAELEDCRWFEREEVLLMLAGVHPDGILVPPNMAIAHQLIAAFAEWKEA